MSQTFPLKPKHLAPFEDNIFVQQLLQHSSHNYAGVRTAQILVNIYHFLGDYRWSG